MQFLFWINKNGIADKLTLQGCFFIPLGLKGEGRVRVEQRVRRANFHVRASQRWQIWEADILALYMGLYQPHSRHCCRYWSWSCSWWSWCWWSCNPPQAGQRHQSTNQRISCSTIFQTLLLGWRMCLSPNWCSQKGNICGDIVSHQILEVFCLSDYSCFKV